MSIRPDMIGIVVRDLERSLGFYRLLGLAIPSPEKEEAYVDVTTPNGYRISWNALSMVKELDPGWLEPVGHRMELAFLCDSPAEVDATYTKIERAGHKGHKAPWDAFWGQRYAIVEDPDGNRVSLFAPLGGGRG
jgi:catechol 2,3-dioxygenase-like lactoylglutathione lyase family enzyme